MNPDHYIEGTFDERNPCNQEELEIEPTELDILEDEVYRLERIIKQQEQLIELRMSQLRELKEIDRMTSTFGSASFEDQLKKNEIYKTF